MSLRIAFLVSALSLFVQPAIAQDAFIKGVYSSAEGCAAMKANKQSEGDFIFLSATGLQGIEFRCDFVQVFPRKDLPGWTAIAFCEEPGLSFPGLFSILPLNETTLSLGTTDSAQDDADEAPAAGEAETDDDPGLDGEYQLCAAK